MANLHLLGIIVGNWWILAFRRLAAILFGAAAFAWPGLILFALVVLFGVVALVDGIVASVASRALCPLLESRSRMILSWQLADRPSELKCS